MLFRLVRATNVDKKTNPAQLLSRSLQAISEGGVREFGVGLYLSDSPHGEISAVERVAKAFPILRECIVEITDPSDRRQTSYKAVSTLNRGPWPTRDADAAQRSLPVEMVSEIAAGVPKRWPADDFLVVIDIESWPGMHVPQFDESETPSQNSSLSFNPTAYLRPSLLVGSEWWTPRRMSYLVAIVPFASNGDEPTLPLSQTTAQILDQLGTTATTSVNAILSESEMHGSQQLHARLNELAKSYVVDAHQLLRPVPEAETDLIRLGDPAAKEAIRRAFRGRGFRYTWLARGAYRLVKFSATGYRCVVDVDVAPMARLVRVEYCVEGPSLSIRVPVPTSVGDKPTSQQAIDPPERLDGLLENAARVVAHYEKQLLPTLERNLPKCPQWFKSV